MPQQGQLRRVREIGRWKSAMRGCAVDAGCAGSVGGFISIVMYAMAATRRETLSSSAARESRVHPVSAAEAQ